MIPALGTVLCACGVSTDDPVECAALVAVAVETTDEVPSVLVSECDGYVLGGHFKLVDEKLLLCQGKLGNCENGSEQCFVDPVFFTGPVPDSQRTSDDPAVCNRDAASTGDSDSGLGPGPVQEDDQVRAAAEDLI